MDTYMCLDRFDAIYLVDLCEPLLAVARQRLAKFDNVHVVKADAAVLELDIGQVDVITMSYSLSMIPPYFKVLDRALDLLKPEGVVSVVDFFTSNKDDASLGEPRRQGSLLNRLFWKTWFEFDHVDLNPARRDYLEYKFECIKSISCRNNFVVPFVVSIPYYIYLGQKSPQISISLTSSTVSSISDLKQTTSPRLMNMPPTPEATPVMSQHEQKQTMMDDLQELAMPAAQLSSSAAHAPAWSTHRQPYDPTHPDQAQFQDFIYSFVWEDPEEDVRRMEIQSTDEMLVITSAGDNALDYLVTANPAKIHCVDMNPCQGHLLELKIASIKRLSFDEHWQLFGRGKCNHFRKLLDRMAPNMSAAAYQFWSAREQSFDKCFYKLGYAGNVVSLLDWLFWLSGTQSAARCMASASDLGTQRMAWQTLRRAFTNPAVNFLLLANPVFLWNALGVPVNQFRMLLEEGSALKYAIDTLDPVANKTLLSQGNHHYLLPLLKHYIPECCPSYLRPEHFASLGANSAALLNALVLHTDTINNVLSRMPERSLSKAIVMDHQDWFDKIPADAAFPQPGSYLDCEIALFRKVLKHGGEVWWRSAARRPWYADRWSKGGFEVRCIASRDGRDLLDKVNMYASLWRARLD